MQVQSKNPTDTYAIMTGASSGHQKCAQSEQWLLSSPPELEPINSEEETESVVREWQDILKSIQEDIEADIPDFEYSDNDCSMMEMK